MSVRTRRTAGEPALVLAEHDAAAPPLLLLHGVTRNHDDWSPIMERLAADWRVLAIDQRGHGGSARADRYLVVDYVSDAVRIIRDEIGTPVVMLGHSLGAMVAAGAAAAIPDLVQGIVLEDPPFHAMGERIIGTAWEAQFIGMREAAARGGSVAELATALAAISLPTPDGGTVRLGDLRPPESLRRSAAALASLDSAVLTPLIAGRWLDGYDPVAIAADVRCPVRLLQADPTAGGALADAECAAFAAAASDCTVERFPGAGHLLHWTDPDSVCNAVATLTMAARGPA